VVAQPALRADDAAPGQPPADRPAAAGKRGEDLLPEVRDWMTNNSWVISKIVIAFFLALTISSLLG
jgi:hypothetical protein